MRELVKAQLFLQDEWVCKRLSCSVSAPGSARTPWRGKSSEALGENH